MEIIITKFGGIDHGDYPDYCDAYAVEAEKNGAAMTDEEIDKLNDDRSLINEQLFEYLYL